MHPKESKKQRTGTGRLCKISMKDCEIIEGIDFSENARLNELLNNPEYFPVVMYPGPDALTARSPELLSLIKNPSEDKSTSLTTRKLLPILIDGTWFCAKKIIQKNPALLSLPKVSFYGKYTSIFTFKKEPEPEYISTLETCYYFIKELQENKIISAEIDPEPLMNVFKQMIKFQLQAENERIMGLRPDVHASNFKYKKIKEVPDFEIREME